MGRHHNEHNNWHITAASGVRSSSQHFGLHIGFDCVGLLVFYASFHHSSKHDAHAIHNDIHNQTTCTPDCPLHTIFRWEQHSLFHNFNDCCKGRPYSVAEKPRSRSGLDKFQTFQYIVPWQWPPKPTCLYKLPVPEPARKAGARAAKGKGRGG